LLMSCRRRAPTAIPGSNIASEKTVLSGLQFADANAAKSNTDKHIDATKTYNCQNQNSDLHARPVNPT